MGDVAAKRKAMETKSELAHILAKFGSESASTVIYIIMVVSNGTKWLVGHRYSTFELLRRYFELELHNPNAASHNGHTPTDDGGGGNDNNPLAGAPPFPGKVFGFMSSSGVK